jgi:hypothetical protein
MNLPFQSALALLVTRIGANDEKLAVTPHELAVLTNAFDAGSHLHRRTPTSVHLQNLANRYYIGTQKNRQARGINFAAGKGKSDGPGPARLERP